DLGCVAIFDGQNYLATCIRFLGKQNIAFVDYDRAITSTLVGEREAKAAGPVIPTSGLVNKSVFADDRKFAQREADICSCIRHNLHLFCISQEVGVSQDAFAILLSGDHTNQYCRWLYCQEYLGAAL